MSTIIINFWRSYLNNYSGLNSKSWILITIHFIESLAIGLIYYLSVYFQKELNFSMSLTGTVFSCYGIGAIFGSILAGKLFDKTSGRLLLPLSILLQSVNFILLSISTTATYIMPIMFSIGIASYAFITLNQLSLLNAHNNSDSQKLRAINILSTSSNLGLSLTAIGASKLYYIGFSKVIFAAGIILLLSSYTIASTSRSSRKQSNKSVKDRLNNSSIPAKINRNQSNTKLLITVLVNVLLIGSVISQRSTTYTIYIINKFSNYGINSISTLFIINTLMVVTMETPIGNLLSTKNKIQMIGIGGLLIGAGMAILPFSNYYPLAIFACIIYTLGEIVFFCMAQFVCYEKAPKQSKGRSLGLFRMTYGTSRIIGPFAGGVIYQNIGGDLLWYTCGAIGIFCLISCYCYMAFD
jgi:predicted MFS family arabinose efflux permease